jgi:hypothetical protein
LQFFYVVAAVIRFRTMSHHASSFVLLSIYENERLLTLRLNHLSMLPRLILHLFPFISSSSTRLCA